LTVSPRAFSDGDAETPPRRADLCHSYSTVIRESSTPGGEREQLVEAHHVASRDFDRTVTSLAGGALALSVTFIHGIARHPEHTWTLVTAWLALGLSLLLILLSFMTSQAGLLRRIEAIDASMAESQETRYFRATNMLNFGAAAGLVIGFGFLAAFSFSNI